MQFQKENILNKLCWVYSVGFFAILALPLLNLPPWFSPPDFGKTVIFRIIMSVLIFTSICQIIFQENKEKNKDVNKWKNKKRWEGKNQEELENGCRKIPPIGGILRQPKSPVFWSFWFLIGLLGIYFLATLFSQDVLFSLWGSPYRSGGFVNFALYIILAILMFFILKKSEWQKIWIFSFIIGVLVSLIAIFQQYKIFSPFLLSYEGGRAPSTIGSPITLAIYLLILCFPVLSFGLKTKKVAGKLFYFISFLLFIFTAVFITQTRAVYLGLIIGSFYFLTFFPFKKKWLAIGLKIITTFILILSVYAVYYINITSQSKFLDTIAKNQLIKGVMTRVSFRLLAEEPRFAVWKVAFEAIKEKPILGYGPENFNIGFDRFYDSSLPYISHEWGSWYDKAHNFILDIATTVGIPALMIYLALFGALFWRLQKLKTADKYADSDADKTPIIAHGLQASFIGYFVANFFSFDSFSSYLISFLLIGYSLHLISLNVVNKEKSAKETFNNTLNRAESSVLNQRNYQHHLNVNKKKFIIVALLFLFIWFNWQYNIKPFNINTKINISKYLIGEKKCESAFSRMEKNVLPKKSILNFYSRAKYIDFMTTCESYYPDKTADYAKRGIGAIKEGATIRPAFVRGWLFLSGFNTVLIDIEQDIDKKVELVKAGENYLKKAELLAPKRQEVFIEWFKYAFTSDRFDLLKEKAQKCIDTNPDTGDCYWYRALAELTVRNLEQGEKYLTLAEMRRYDSGSFISISQLEKAHSIAGSYQELVVVYQKLIALKPEEPQYHASLAFTYRELGKFKEARSEAMKVLELQPEAKDMVQEFLKTLPLR